MTPSPFAYVWASPATILGLILAPFFDARRVDRGVLVCEGARWPRRLGWRYDAITFGHVVLATAPMDAHLLAHERAHVRQYEAWGPLFLPAYALASLWALFRGRGAHDGNHFERAADRSALRLERR